MIKLTYRVIGIKSKYKIYKIYFNDEYFLEQQCINRI